MEGVELWVYCELKTYTLSSALFNHSTELKEFSLFSKPYWVKRTAGLFSLFFQKLK